MCEDMAEQATYFQHFLNTILGRPLMTGSSTEARYKNAGDVEDAWQHARAECIEFERALEELNFPFSADVLNSVDSFKEWQESLAYRKEDELQALGVTLEFDDRDAATSRQISAGESLPGLELYAYARRKEIRQKYRDAALHAITTTPWLRAYLEDLRRLDGIPDTQERVKETMRLWIKHSGQNDDI